ncbi:MAG: inositol monophosphatase family protein [Nitrospirota bacterium]
MRRTETEYAAWLDLAVDAARAAGEIIRTGMSDALDIRYKGAINLVTQIDVAAERAVVERLRARTPDHDILAEEGSNRTGGSPYRWLIDPLDGTTNYAHRFPFFCVSIGLQQDDHVVLGVVLDPVRDELFAAVRGGGATLNGSPLSVSATETLDKSLVVTGFAYDPQYDTNVNFRHFEAMSRVVRGVRRTGSAALDLCYVAAGRSDGFWELALSPWDTAAGQVIVEEAGGRVTDFSGRAFSPDIPEILATNGKIHDAMLAVLNQRPLSPRD